MVQRSLGQPKSNIRSGITGELSLYVLFIFILYTDSNFITKEKKSYIFFFKNQDRCIYLFLISSSTSGGSSTGVLKLRHNVN